MKLKQEETEGLEDSPLSLFAPVKTSAGGRDAPASCAFSFRTQRLAGEDHGQGSFDDWQK